MEVTALKGFIANTALCSLCNYIAHRSRNRLGQEFRCESQSLNCTYFLVVHEDRV